MAVDGGTPLHYAAWKVARSPTPASSAASATPCTAQPCDSTSNGPTPTRPIPHLDPALRARLVSALQRPDLKPTTRAKIEALLGRKNEPQETLCPK